MAYRLLFQLPTKTVAPPGDIAGLVSTELPVANCHRSAPVEDNNLYAIRIAEWTLVEIQIVAGVMYSKPSMGSATEFATRSNYILAVDAASGAERWRFVTGGVVWSSPAISAGGATVFVGSEDHNLYAIDASATADLSPG